MQILTFMVVFLCKYSCTMPPEKPLPAVQTARPKKAAIISLEADEIASALTSVEEIKDMLFAELQAHQSDTAYKHSMTLRDTINESLYQAEIRIGRLFHPTLKSAVLGWSVSDTTMDMEIFDLHDDGSRTSSFSAHHQPSISDSPLSGEFLYFEDYDHDGWKDLEVVIEAWNGVYMGSRSRLWLVRQGRFSPVQFFENIVSPQPDPVNRRIYSYHSGGCADMAMHFSVWQLMENAVKMTKEINIDCCAGSHGKCLVTINGGKSIPVAGNKIHLYVPGFYKAWLKEKMKD